MISGSGLLAMRNKLQTTDHKIFAWAPLFWALSVTAVIAQETVEADDTSAPSDAITTDSEEADGTDSPQPINADEVLDYEPTESISRDSVEDFPVDI